MKIFCIFMIYYYICSVGTAINLWKKFHSDMNKEELEADLIKLMKLMKNDGYSNYTREDALVSFYLIGVFFSFIIVPVYFVKKILGKKNVR